MGFRFRSTALTTLCTGLVALASAANASAEDAVYANGNNVFDSTKAVVSYFDMGCGDTVFGNSPEHPCAVAASGTISVSAATRKKLGLASSVIARGTSIRNGPSNSRLDFKASAAARKRLARVASVPVVIELRFTSPASFTMPITEKLTMGVKRANKPSSRAHRVLFNWDKSGAHLSR